MSHRVATCVDLLVCHSRRESASVLEFALTLFKNQPPLLLGRERSYIRPSRETPRRSGYQGISCLPRPWPSVHAAEQVAATWQPDLSTCWRNTGNVQWSPPGSWH